MQTTIKKEIECFRPPPSWAGNPIDLFNRLGGLARWPVSVAMLISGIIMFAVCSLGNRQETHQTGSDVFLLTYNKGN